MRYRAGGSIVDAATGEELNAVPGWEAEERAARARLVDGEIAMIRRARFEETRAGLRRLGFDTSKYRPIPDDPIEPEIPAGQLLIRPALGHVIEVR